MRAESGGRGITLSVGLMVLAGTLLFAPILSAQDDGTGDKGVDSGNYNIHQVVDFGYRLNEVNGNQNTYNTFINLGSGVRLFDYSFDMRSLNHQGFLFDDLSFSNFGYGGDPNDVSRLHIEKNKWYDFHLLFRRDKNFWDYNLWANPLNPAAVTRGGWKLVKTVTAFTVSHSITLTLATLGYVHIPQRPVEAVIALSIVFVAAEILRGRQGHVGITARAPWIVALMFGLMHGLGFASGLKDAGLPNAHIPTALLFFSIGVEAGHFLFIGFVLSFIAATYWFASRLTYINQQRLAVLELLAPYAIGSVAMFWVIQRIATFAG